MVSPVNSPHSSNQGTGHQAGAGEPKSWFGRSANKSRWIAVVSARKP